ncbi:hypothetical protein BGZ63DRAFT_389918 [Mariannaea sp. PMI_226]|nr:hypothetical protein BGZ63DRAFT_389918 [Mariannaea sp. PMI_226]
MATFTLSVQKSERLVPARARGSLQTVALSLLDCTAADFAPASAVWLFSKPNLPGAEKLDLHQHFRTTLAATLEAYPQWCGQLIMVDTTDGIVPAEAQHLPIHSRRLGQIYARFGAFDDPGVEFVWATSSETLETLYPLKRKQTEPVWNCQEASLRSFVANTPLAPVFEPNFEDDTGRLRPLMSAQITQLACDGLVLSLKIRHALADTTTLMTFVKDWAHVSRAVLIGGLLPDIKPSFNPALLDQQAAGDIDQETPDLAIIQQAESLKLHRYDWWASASTCPWPVYIPKAFDSPVPQPSGKVMPWTEWDLSAPVSNYVIHLTRDQVDFLFERANKNGLRKLSRHDAILGHIWSCIARARELMNDSNPVHCDLVSGVRRSFELDERFLGSPVIMTNVELPGSLVAASANLNQVATQIRETLGTIANPANLSAHLHSVAYEKSPQRIWQAFLGKRHIMVTTWARAGIYNIDFGLENACIYTEGIVPDMDGIVLIKEAPGPAYSSWTDNGVDVSVHIRTEDMKRLIEDPLLLPSTSVG